jgi:hypothetical protein
MNAMRGSFLAASQEKGIQVRSTRSLANSSASSCSSCCLQADPRAFVLFAEFPLWSIGTIEQVVVDGASCFAFIGRGRAVTFSHHCAEYFGVIQLPPMIPDDA